LRNGFSFSSFMKDGVWHSGSALVMINVGLVNRGRTAEMSYRSSRFRTIRTFNEPPRLTTQPGHPSEIGNVNTIERWRVKGRSCDAPAHYLWSRRVICCLAEGHKKLETEISVVPWAMVARKRTSIYFSIFVLMSCVRQVGLRQLSNTR